MHQPEWVQLRPTETETLAKRLKLAAMWAVLARLEALEERDNERECQVQALERSIAALELCNVRLEATVRALQHDSGWQSVARSPPLTPLPHQRRPRMGPCSATA